MGELSAKALSGYQYRKGEAFHGCLQGLGQWVGLYCGVEPRKPWAIAPWTGPELRLIQF